MRQPRPLGAVEFPLPLRSLSDAPCTPRQSVLHPYALLYVRQKGTVLPSHALTLMSVAPAHQ